MSVEEAGWENYGTPLDFRATHGGSRCTPLTKQMWKAAPRCLLALTNSPQFLAQFQWGETVPPPFLAGCISILIA